MIFWAKEGTSRGEIEQVRVDPQVPQIPPDKLATLPKLKIGEMLEFAVGSDRMTVVKWKCWVCGVHPSNVARERDQSHRIGGPTQTETEKGNRGGPCRPIEYRDFPQ